MGSVVPEVMTGHLADYPDEESILRPFVQNFDVTWARRWRAFGSDLSLYFFKPEKHMERAFGFESEILAVYSQYDALHVDDQDLYTIVITTYIPPRQVGDGPWTPWYADYYHPAV